MNKTIDIHETVGADSIASAISKKYDDFKVFRSSWTGEVKELRNYVYATDTSTTSNGKLPWANSTTTPKLTQLYDNLKANYYYALFPNASPFTWDSSSLESSTREKRDAIESFITDKTKARRFPSTVERCVDDWILTGNCFGEVSWENTSKYVGPVLHRISPFDIVFDVTASSFDESPKIIRSIKTLGQTKKMAQSNPKLNSYIGRMLRNRSEISSGDHHEKSDGYLADGFSSVEHYYSSGKVEFLTFYGDLFNTETNEYKINAKIVVVDRAYVIYDEEWDSDVSNSPVFHSGWRNRPDNLMAMGPLSNLVGMQYRIDHLENLRADVFDQIALPALKISGEVEDFEWGPGCKIWTGEEGDVVPLVPDATALQADFQIATLENKMEELAGAPKMAMGHRTPGEKTAFEVSSLQSAGSRIFEHKAAQFEREFIEPVLNLFLEISVKNLGDTPVEVLSKQSDNNVRLFNTITRDDLIGQGSIHSQGARHFAEKALRVQNLTNLGNIMATVPSVAPHISGKRIAQILAEELGEPEVFGEDIAIQEQAETQDAQMDAQADVEEKQAIKAQEGL